MKNQYKQKFYDMYARIILPKFMNYESKRQGRLFLLILQMGILLCIFLSTLYIFIVYIHGNAPFYSYANNEFFMIVEMLLFVGSIIGLILLPSYADKKFKREIKKICEPIFAKCFENLVWYDPKSDITNSLGITNILEESNLFSIFNRISTDDVFSVTHEGVKITVIETHLQDVQGSGKNRRTYEVFKGVVIIVPSNKPVKAHTIVTSKGDNKISNTRIGVVSGLICMILSFIGAIIFNDLGNAVAFGIGVLVFGALMTRKRKHFEKVELEDVEFDKRFKVASENQIEARYLVTPAFMDRLKSLQTAFGTKNVKCSFFDDKIMFAISTNKDLFEVGTLTVPLNNSKQMTEFFNELSSILQLIDYFKLDEKTGL